KTIGTALRQELRETDFLVSYTPDELLILSPGVNRNQAETLKSRLQDVLDGQQYKLPSESVSLAVSIGISVFPEEGDTLNALLTSAETALQGDTDLRAAVRSKVRQIARD